MNEGIALIEEIFFALKENGIVSDRSEFITKWLEREESYIRVLRSKKRNPSEDVFRSCADGLSRYAATYGQSQMPQLRIVASLFERLSHKCRNLFVD